MEDIYELNQYGLRVKKCCASCAHKNLEHDPCTGNQRWCDKREEAVFIDDVCESWEMGAIGLAGKGEKGKLRIKRQEYVDWFGANWPKLKALGWDAADLRNHWERQNGVSIYM